MKMYRVPDVCRAARISYRQLDYWTRLGIVSSSVRSADGPGTQRVYSERDLQRVKAIASLLQLGWRLEAVAKMFEAPSPSRAIEQLAIATDRIADEVWVSQQAVAS